MKNIFVKATLLGTTVIGIGLVAFGAYLYSKIEKEGTTDARQ